MPPAPSSPDPGSREKGKNGTAGASLAFRSGCGFEPGRFVRFHWPGGGPMLLPVQIPTEPIGSIPRPLSLIDAAASIDGADPALDPLYDEAIRDTIAQFEATGSPVITDGEQRKYHNFWTYCVHG